MNAKEAASLCRLAKAACPQQAFDQYTPDAWHLLLSDLSLDDAKEALVAVAKQQPFVSPSEIRAEVARVHNARIKAAEPLQPPREIADKDYPAWLAATRRQVATGALVIEAPQLEATPERSRRYSDEVPVKALIGELRKQWAAKVDTPPFGPDYP